MSKQLCLILALVPTVGLSAASAASQPATIHGVVYACETRQPLAHARVTLRGVDDGGTYRLVSDAAGRFTQVGVMPGRWNIQAGRGADTAFASTRQALLEDGDNLSMVIGVRTQGPMRRVSSDANVVHTDCDAFRVPQAPTTADRYIIR
jgi:hypothetical protein